MQFLQTPLKTAGVLGAVFTAAILLSPSPSSAEDSVVSPTKRPQMIYPSKMVQQGISGECNTVFDVSPTGEPENISAECSHPGFVEVVLRAASTLRYTPKIEEGVAVRQTAVEYPFIFKIDPVDR